MKAKTYNGHRNYNHWNVSLWINNDEGLYRMARDYARKAKGCGGNAQAAEWLLSELPEHTPDGAHYSLSSVKAALSGILS